MLYEATGGGALQDNLDVAFCFKVFGIVNFSKRMRREEGGIFRKGSIGRTSAR